MDKITNYFKGIKKPTLETFASIVTAFLIAINLIFMFVMTILVVMMCVNVIIAVFYQSSLPISVGASFGCVSLAAISFPWLLALVATACDFSQWPIKYGLFRYGMKVLLGLQAPRHNAEKAEHLRRLGWYLLPFVIWITSSAIGLAGGKQANTGTILFLVLSLLYIIVNAFYDVVYLKGTDVDKSALLFVLFAEKRGVISCVCVTISLMTTIVNSIKVPPSTIAGGRGAVAASVILLILYFCFHLGIYLSRTVTGHKEFVARSKRTYIIAGVEIFSLFLSGILIATNFSGSDSVGVWVFFVFVVVTYATLYFRDVRVDLSAMIAKEKNSASRSGYGGADGDDDGALEEQGEQGEDTSPSTDYKKFDQSENATTHQEKEILPREEGSVSIPAVSGDDNNNETAENNSRKNSNNNNNNGETTESSVSRCSDFFYDDDERRKLHGKNNNNTNNTNQEGTLEQSLVTADLSQNFSASSYVPERRNVPTRTQIYERKVLAKRIATVILIISCLLMFGASLIDTSSDNKAISCPGIYPGNNDTSKRFSICETELIGGLSISDYAALTAASYMKTDNFYQALKTYFPHENVTVIGGSDVDGTAKEANFVGVHYWSVRFTRPANSTLKNISIVVVRGSALSIDWQQDVLIGSDVTTLRLGMGLLPVFFSDDLMATLIDVMGAIKFGIRSYTDPAFDEVNRLKRIQPDDEKAICGHSLGGFVTSIVAAKAAIRSVGFSPVGTALQRKRYDFSVTTGNEVITSVIPAHDLVPKVDKQLGNIQNIISVEPCGPKNAICHSMKLTQRSLALNCGDPFGRRVIKSTDPIPAGCHQ